MDKSELPNPFRLQDRLTAGQDSGGKDPLMSPLSAPDELLAKLPPITIGAVLLDPLLDDAVAFAKRLDALGNKVRLRVFPDLSRTSSKAVTCPGSGAFPADANGRPPSGALPDNLGRLRCACCSTSAHCTHVPCSLPCSLPCTLPCAIVLSQTAS